MRNYIVCRLIVYVIPMVAISVGCNQTDDPSRNPNVTKDNFDMISNGMSEAEVKTILGDPDMVFEPGKQSPRQFVVVDYVEVGKDHVWKANLRDLAEDAKSINVGFKDGKVAAKSQAGL